jgi:hypothetical protein
MFNSSNSTSSSQPKFFTGLAPFKVIGVNPSKEQIEKFINREYKLNVNYEIVEMNGRSYRPIEIWVQEVNNNIEPLPLRFLISTASEVTQSGTSRMVNSVGTFTYVKDLSTLDSNTKMSWFTKHKYRNAMIGEYELYSFMQQLMRYSSNGEGASFLADAEANGITIPTLYNNDLKGLSKFFEWCNTNNNTIVLLTCVRSTSKIVGDEEKVYYNQALCTNPDFFFRSSGDVTQKAIDAVKTAHAKGERITKYFFTAEFQPFIKEECLNAVPTEVVNNTSSNTGEGFSYSSLI